MICRIGHGAQSEAPGNYEVEQAQNFRPINWAPGSDRIMRVGFLRQFQDLPEHSRQRWVVGQHRDKSLSVAPCLAGGAKGCLG